MRNFISLGLAGSMLAMMVCGPIAYKIAQDRQQRNFHVVQEGVLYRSGQLPLLRLRELVATHGFRTVVSLREGDKQDDKNEEAWVKARGLNFVRIPPRQWSPDSNGKVAGDKSLEEFRKVMDDPAKYPVLVHCFAGIHRTGKMCAVFRMDYQGWTNEEAMSEMRTIGYTMLDDHEDVLSYLIRYHPPHDAKGVNAIPAKFRK